MTVVRTWALTVMAWGAMTTLAHADPTSLLWDWSAWAQSGGVVGGNTNSGGSSPTLSSPTTAISDAFLNFGTDTSSYPGQSALTIGTPQPWYDSPAVTKVYGGVPTPAQQRDFISSVENDVEHTFTASGLTGSNAVSITTDPNASARHTLSIASGLSYGSNPNAIGITQVGGNGFGFIDKLAYASTPQDLEWAVAHNVSHELMHAFGVGVHHDQTGNYLDAAKATWPLLTDPNATLSPDAVSDIIGHNVGRDGNMSAGASGQGLVDGDQEILETVPEPSTIALWGLAAMALILHQRRRGPRARPA
jgi:hypothetical protein